MSNNFLVLEQSLNSEKFSECKSSVAKLLFILSVLYSINEASFLKLMSLRRGKLKLLSNSEMEIQRSALDPCPKQIPDSPYWIATKTSTEFKRKMLKEILEILEYNSDIVNLVMLKF